MIYTIIDRHLIDVITNSLHISIDDKYRTYGFDGEYWRIGDEYMLEYRIPNGRYYYCSSVMGRTYHGTPFSTRVFVKNSLDKSVHFVIKPFKLEIHKGIYLAIESRFEIHGEDVHDEIALVNHIIQKGVNCG